MRKIILTAISALLTVSTFAVEKDPLVGFYRAEAHHGTLMCAEVFRTGTEASPIYRLKFQPAVLNRSEIFAQINNLKAENGEIKFDNGAYSGVVTKDGIKLAQKHQHGTSNYKLKPYKVVSPTMGAKAPEDAVVLFDGKNMDAWVHLDGSSPKWEIQEGDMIVKPVVKNAEGKNSGGSMRTKEKFDGALKLHVEFNLPPNYGNDSPGRRANSGVYFGDFEVQVLEGFGFDGNWGDIGAIYRQIPPQVNACTEPGSWQTFDIIFKPVKIEDGKVLLPRLTVWHNGIRVQSDAPVKYATALYPEAGAKYKHKEGPISLQLQDHGAPIRYRNIWIEKLD